MIEIDILEVNTNLLGGKRWFVRQTPRC